MSTSIWGGPEVYNDEAYPGALLKYLLKHMMAQFGAQGGCIALYDEHIGQMRVRLHLRSSTNQGALRPNVLKLPSRRMTRHLGDEPVQGTASITGSSRSTSQVDATTGEELEEVAPQFDNLFAVGSSYPIGVDLIGYAWHKNEPYIMRRDDYVSLFKSNHLEQYGENAPSSYLVVPIQESTLVDDAHGRRRNATTLGVVVLYQVPSGPGIGFHTRQRGEAMQFAERIALYLQNDRLQRSQRRTSEYLQQLQEISTVFPNSVKLSELVENIYRFTSNVVDFSSLLLTLYDRDTTRIYDVLAIQNGQRKNSLSEQPMIWHQENRPTWWRVTQIEKVSLQFSPAQEPVKANEYHELLSGMWGDQRQAESFLLLPMKMFNRVVGSLSLSATHPNAFNAEKVQVLETMLQIVTVGIENVKLYERDRELLRKGRQREEELAAINSTLQSISLAVSPVELLNNFVERVAKLARVTTCVFFQPTPNKEELVAQAMYAPPSTNTYDDGSELPNILPELDERSHAELIKTIRLPFTGMILEQSTSESFFYLDSAILDELAQSCSEDSGWSIFLHVLNIEQLLMIPLSYQSDLIGVLAVPAAGEHNENRSFRPKDVGTLLAICAQASSAIRNAQLFEEREEAYAELERMSKLKDEFLVTASHELRTPLSAITGYSTLLKRQSARLSPQQVLRYASKIAGAAQQLTDLVGTMTEAAKIGAVDKKLELQIGLVQLRTAANLASNLIGINIEQTIHVDVEADLWVSGDPLRVRQVLTNLLDNAAKYSPPDKLIRITATPFTLAAVSALLPEDQVDHSMLAEHAEEQVVLVRVHDQGEGIPPDDQEKIFEKFVRAQRSLTTPVRGTGLGLFICRRFIEAMNGRLWLERSTPNEGSVFSFYLPRVETPVTVEEQDEREYTNS